MPIIPSNTIPASPSPQLQVVLTWLEALSAGDPQAVNVLATTLTDDYTYQLLPRSLGYPVRNKEWFLSYARKVPLGLFRNPQLDIHQIIEAPRQIVVQASSTATFHTGALYKNEYIAVYHLAQQIDGAWKISKAEEFVDSRASAAFFPINPLRPTEGAETLGSRL